MSGGYKDFAAGAVLTAADLEQYCELQGIMKFASAAARNTALSSVLEEGLFAYLLDTNTLTVYTGSAWSTIGPVHGTATSWTPAVTQSGSVTVTVNSATYFRTGRLINAFFDLTVTGTGSATNDVVISLPVACRAGITYCGFAEIYDTSGSDSFNGPCKTASTTTFKIQNTGQGAVDRSFFGGSSPFTAALANTDTIVGYLTYEAGADA